MANSEHVRSWRGAAAALVLAGLGGCGIFGKGEVDRTAKMSPQEIHAEAKDEMSSGPYGEAAKLLVKLESRYPFAPGRSRRSSTGPTPSTRTTTAPRR